MVDAFLDALDEALEIRERFPVPASEGRPSRRRRADDAPGGGRDALDLARRLRRWADEGRIAAIRTAGGHRRFPLEAVRRLAAERGVRPTVRPVEPPDDPAAAARPARAPHGRQMAAAAAAAVYRDGPPGWFATEARRARAARVARGARRELRRAAPTRARCRPRRR